MRPEPGRSVAFDRVAHEYDATRGGDERGRTYAEALAPLLPTDGTLLEVGIGTGVVAAGLRQLGCSVVGIDLSPEMLHRAVERVGRAVAVGDAHRLPVRDAAVAAAYSVWVLHLVADQDAVLRDVHRVVRPGGRYVVATSATDPPDDDDEVGRWVWDMQDALRDGMPKPDHRDVLVPAAASAGWAVTSDQPVSLREWDDSPAAAVAAIESRTWSLLWDVDPATWDRFVVPVLAGLKALPDQERPRTRRSRDRLLVLDRIEP